MQYFFFQYSIYLCTHSTGTGTNACYVEKIENVENYTGPPGSHTIISTEWAGLGESGVLDFIRTEYDREVDEHSTNRGYEM